MIRSASIQNFRCYRSVEIDDLGRVNVVVGDNGSGKTCLLEALFLVTGNNAGNALRCRAWRGLGSEIQIGGAEAYHALWRDLFYKLDDTSKIQISVLGSSNRALRISYSSRKAAIPIKGEGAIQWIEFAFQDAKKQWHPTLVSFDKTGLQGKVAPIGIEAAMFSASGAISPKETADRFSSFSKKNKHRPIVSAMTHEFPNIVDLSVESDPSVGAMVYATLSTSDQKMPVGLLSSGINRWLAYLIAIQSYPGGVVMIDEIESGLYYRHFKAMWESVNAVSKTSHTQVFAAVHSGECLDALQTVMTRDAEDFRLLQVSPGAEQPSIRVFRGDDFAAAIGGHVEVR